MKRKRKRIILVTALVLLAVLFIPIPTGVMNDGGSREFTALTYKIVRWNRLIASEDSVKTYTAWRFYPIPLNFADIDDLWTREVSENPGLVPAVPLTSGFYATVSEIRERGLLVDGLDTNELNYRYEFSLSVKEDTALIRDGVSIALSDIRAGDTVLVEFTGEIQEVYPARIADVTAITVVTPTAENGNVSYQAEYIRIDGSGNSASALLPFAENNDGTSPDGWNRLPVISIETKTELHQLIPDLKETEAYKDGCIWNDTALFTEFTSAYDETFFSEKNLLLVYIAEGSGSNSHRIYDCSVHNGTCTVVVETVTPDSGTCDMAGWLISLSVEKEAVQNVSFDAYRLSK